MQFFNIYSHLSYNGKIIFTIIILLISLWVYVDSQKRGFKGIVWGGIVFLYPVILFFYLIMRPRCFIGFCKDCGRILPKDSTECFYCRGICKYCGNILSKDSDECLYCQETTYFEKLSLPFSIADRCRIFLLRFLVALFRSYHKFLGLFMFMFKKKFLPLHHKLLYLYSWGMCYQLVATEGSEKGIPRKTLTYGETTYLGAWKIFKFAGINERDVFYDLGSGTGNVVFFCNILYGIKATGIDAIPTFINYSNKIKNELHFDNVEFIEGNFLETDFSDGTVFYIVSSVFDPLTIENLCKKFKSLPSGVRIITVRHEFNAPYLKLKNTMKVLFGWGYDEVYLYEKL